MNDHRDELDEGEEKVLKTALSGSDVFLPRPADDYVASLRRRLLDAAAPRPHKAAVAHRAWMGWLGAATVAISLLVVFWQSRTAPAWASSIRLARQMAWIHARITLDGKVVGESWVSPQYDVVATKLGDTLWFFDYQRGDFLRYDAQSHRVSRAQRVADLNVSASFESPSLLASIFRNNPSIDSLIAGQSVESWSSREAIVDGTAMDEYNLVIRQVGGAQLQSLFIFSVDRATSLPRTLTVLEPDSHRVMCSLDYPNTGPMDAKSLGIPANAPSIDVVTEERVARAADTLKKGRRNFDDFEALYVKFRSPKLRSLAASEVKRVLRRGNRWRVDDVLPSDPNLRLSLDPVPGLKQWRANERELHYSPLAVCDGKMVRYFDAAAQTNHETPGVGPSVIRMTPATAAEEFDDTSFSRFMPQCCCRMLFWTKVRDRLFEVTSLPGQLDRELIKIQVRSPEELHQPVGKNDNIALWLDPSKDYVAMRVLYSTEEPQHVESGDLTTFDEFQRSPAGYWYPTAFEIQQAGRSHAVVGRFYVDFLTRPDLDLFDVGAPTSK